MMDGLLNDDEPPLRFEARQPFAEIDRVGGAVLQLSKMTRVERRHRLARYGSVEKRTEFSHGGEYIDLAVRLNRR